MAAGRDCSLTGEHITKLPAAIAAKDMKTIAEGYMDIAPETVQNIEQDKRGDAEAFNREIIRHWANKNSSPQEIKVIN